MHVFIENSAPSLANGDVQHRVQKSNQTVLCGINIIFIVFILLRKESN